jgi:hypothetical protein
LAAADGRFIAAVGLPSVGKSRVFAELATLLDGQALLEPEEPSWPAAVSERERTGCFTALMWFRSVRVPHCHAADELRRAGKVALLDSYYDKLCVDWLGRPGMEWLIDPGDEYFPVATWIARLDRERLPLADALVVFTVDEPIWHEFIRRRRRTLDADSRLATTFRTQRYFVDAAEKLADETGIRLVRFHQDRVDSPRAAAARLAARFT